MAGQVADSDLLHVPAQVPHFSCCQSTGGVPVYFKVHLGTNQHKVIQSGMSVLHQHDNVARSTAAPKAPVLYHRAGLPRLHAYTMASVKLVCGKVGTRRFEAYQAWLQPAYGKHSAGHGKRITTAGAALRTSTSARPHNRATSQVWCYWCL